MAATTPSTLSVFEPDSKGCRWERVDPLGETRTLCELPAPCYSPEAKWSDGGAVVAGVATTTSASGSYDATICVADLTVGRATTVVGPGTLSALGFVGEDATVIAPTGGSGSLLSRLERRVNGQQPDSTYAILRWSRGAWREVTGQLFYGLSGDFGRPRYSSVTPDEEALLDRRGGRWVRVDGIRQAVFLHGLPGADTSAGGPIAVISRGHVSILPRSNEASVEPMVRGKFLLYSGSAPRLYDLDSGTLLYESDTAVGVTFWR